MDGLPVGHPQRHFDSGPVHLLLRQPEEVGGGDVAVEDHQDGGAYAVVVGGAVGGVVAQVGGQALGHGCGPDGPALPLQKEGPADGTPAQDAEGVGVDGAQGAVVPEMTGGPVGRVQMAYLPSPARGPDSTIAPGSRGRRRCAPGCGAIGGFCRRRRCASQARRWRPGARRSTASVPRPPRPGPFGPAGPALCR